MEIKFKSNKDRKNFSKKILLERKYGMICAKKIILRLNALVDAQTLEDLRYQPGRCHELKGDRTDQLSLDLEHPYRLIIEPANQSIPRKEDGGLDWRSVTIIRIIGVEDTHG